MAEQLSLEQQIDLEIQTTGPMSLARYMSLCLSHPRDGYYVKNRPIGQAGDFITAPEVSQMFGELIGFFLVNLWQQMGEPRSFTLLELGPGRGTLMQDALRAACRANGFGDALHLQLLESNKVLRSEQAKRLDAYSPFWTDDVNVLPEDPLLVVANEFFDALPIRQFVKGEKGWHERLVGLRDGKRQFGLSPTTLPFEAAPSALMSAPVGTCLEIGTSATEIMRSISRRIAPQGGGILAIDYGYAENFGADTLQGVRRHHFADPLSDPGETDLSAHVDFGLLSQVGQANGLATTAIVTQGEFLMRLGLGERARMLSQANTREVENIARAVERLTSPEHMGTLFKVLCAHSPGLQPQGFR